MPIFTLIPEPVHSDLLTETKLLKCSFFCHKYGPHHTVRLRIRLELKTRIEKKSFIKKMFDL